MTLHFWQAPEAEIFSAAPRPGSFIPGAMQHLALRLPDEAALVELQSRLRSAGIDVSEVTELGGVRSNFFRDDSGNRLEAACWVDDPTARPIDPAVRRFFADPAPGPAVAELVRGASVVP